MREWGKIVVRVAVTGRMLLTYHVICRESNMRNRYTVQFFYIKLF